MFITNLLLIEWFITPIEMLPAKSRTPQTLQWQGRLRNRGSVVRNDKEWIIDCLWNLHFIRATQRSWMTLLKSQVPLQYICPARYKEKDLGRAVIASSYGSTTEWFHNSKSGINLKSMMENLLPQVCNYYHIHYWEDFDHRQAPKGFTVNGRYHSNPYHAHNHPNEIEKVC